MPVGKQPNDRDAANDAKNGKDDQERGSEDRGATQDGPAAGGSLNFDDDEAMSDRGKNVRSGGTWEAEGADSGELGPPKEILSDRNGPSDPERGKGPKNS